MGVPWLSDWQRTAQADGLGQEGLRLPAAIEVSPTAAVYPQDMGRG